MTRLIPLLLALLALVAAGCGGGDDEARDVLRATFAEAEPIRSGTVDLAVRVDARGVRNLEEPFGVELRGPFASQGAGKAAKFDLDLALSTGDSTLRTGAISDGRASWLKLEGTTYELDPRVLEQLRKGTGSGSGRGGLDLRSLGVDASRWLEDAETVGEEDVAGVRATHVRGEVDVPRLLDDLGKLLQRAGSLGAAGAAVPARLTDDQRKQLEEAVRDARVDVWSGVEDRRLRRLLVDVSFDAPDSDQEGTVRFDLALADLDEEQSIRAPKDPRPLRELQEGLALLAQGLQGQGGQAPQADGQQQDEGTTGGQAAPGGSSYEQCLADAAGDLRAQQACAALLGG